MNFVQQLALAVVGLATAIVQAITGRRRTGVEPTWTPPPPERQDGAVRAEDEERIRERFGEEQAAPAAPAPASSAPPAPPARVLDLERVSVAGRPRARGV